MVSYLGLQLRKMLERAAKWAQIQRKEADSMSEAWPKFVPKWRKMVRAYKKDQTKPKKDRSNPNPFEEPDWGRFAYRYARISELNNL